jgi:hypothetical protein
MDSMELTEKERTYAEAFNRGYNKALSDVIKRLEVLRSLKKPYNLN